MKRVAYYAIHYGKEWLKWSMRSIREHVDDIYVFYSQHPSHGHNTNLQNPDSREELRAISEQFFAHWYEKPASRRFHWEGEHRDWAVKTCVAEGADIILVVDADELWWANDLEDAFDIAYEFPGSIYRVYATHFWRSLDWVCRDPAAPVRILIPGRENREEYIGVRFFHMGYAQSPEIIRYKESIHGHKNEWRYRWFEDKFMAWSPDNPIRDVHPTNENFWNPELASLDENTKIRFLCRDHPYYGINLITDAIRTL